MFVAVRAPKDELALLNACEALCQALNRFDLVSWGRKNLTILAKPWAAVVSYAPVFRVANKEGNKAALRAPDTSKSSHWAALMHVIVSLYGIKSDMLR
jgi:hypothetical protein